MRKLIKQGAQVSGSMQSHMSDSATKNGAGTLTPQVKVRMMLGSSCMKRSASSPMNAFLKSPPNSFHASAKSGPTVAQLSISSSGWPTASHPQ